VIRSAQSWRPKWAAKLLPKQQNRENERGGKPDRSPASSSMEKQESLRCQKQRYSLFPIHSNAYSKRRGKDVETDQWWNKGPFLQPRHWHHSLFESGCL